MNDLLEIGRITKPVGFKGRFKIVSYINSPQVLDSIQDMYVKCRDREPVLYRVKYVKFTRKYINLELEGVEDEEAVRRLIGCQVLVPADRLEALPEGEYYWRDIIGLEVFTVDGTKLGEIETIFETGGNDVYVCTGGEREILLPAIDDVIKEIDFEKRIMIVELLEGL